MDAEKPPLGLLRDIPMTPEMKEEFTILREWRQVRGHNSWAWLSVKENSGLMTQADRSLEEDVKIDHLYRGLLIIFEQTQNGIRIVAAGNAEYPGFSPFFLPILP